MVTTQLASVARPARRTRWALLGSAGVAAFLAPWCVVLARTLPSATIVGNWSLAWVGLDAGEALAASATALLIARQDPRSCLTAAAGGALLLADAWFDVCTSAPGSERAVAIAEAGLLELPLAICAFGFAARQLGDRRGGYPHQAVGGGSVR